MSVRQFRVAGSMQFTGNSEGARKAWESRKRSFKQASAKPAASESAYDKVLHAQSGKYAHMTAAQRAAADKLAADYQARAKGTKASFDKVSAALRAQGVKNPISYLADYADRREAAHPSTPAEVDALNAANQRMGAQAKATERAAQVKPKLTPAAQAIKDKVPFLDDEAARIAADDQFDKEWDEAWDGELDTESKLPRGTPPAAKNAGVGMMPWLNPRTPSTTQVPSSKGLTPSNRVAAAKIAEAHLNPEVPSPSLAGVHAQLRELGVEHPAKYLYEYQEHKSKKAWKGGPE